MVVFRGDIRIPGVEPVLVLAIYTLVKSHLFTHVSCLTAWDGAISSSRNPFQVVWGVVGRYSFGCTFPLDLPLGT